MKTRRGNEILKNPELKGGKERKVFQPLRVPASAVGRGRGEGKGKGKGRGRRGKRPTSAAQEATQSRDALVITGQLKTGPDFDEPLCFPPLILGDKFSATLLEAPINFPVELRCH